MKTAAIIALGVVSLVGFASIIRSVWLDYTYRHTPLGSVIVIAVSLTVMICITLMTLITLVINN